MSESLQPHGLQPSRILCPRDFPGENTGVVCHFLLQGIFPMQGWNPHLLHWQVDSLPLSHQGSPRRNIACLMWLSTYPSLARGTQSRILLLQGQGGIWLQYSPHQDSASSQGGVGWERHCREEEGAVWGYRMGTASASHAASCRTCRGWTGLRQEQVSRRKADLVFVPWELVLPK